MLSEAESVCVFFLFLAIVRADFSAATKRVMLHAHQISILRIYPNVLKMMMSIKAVVRHVVCKPGFCVQCAAPTLVRTTALVDSSQTLERRCVTAEEATVGRIAPWVSYTPPVEARI